jgi:hypothetical protein
MVFTISLLRYVSIHFKRKYACSENNLERKLTGKSTDNDSELILFAVSSSMTRRNASNSSASDCQKSNMEL